MKDLKEINDKIEELASIEFDQQEHKRLLVQYKNVTEVQAFEDFIKGCKAFMKGLGAVSIILAFGVPLMFAAKMPDLYYPSLLFFSALIIAVEYSKHWNLKRFNTLRIINKDKKRPISLRKYIFASVLFIVGSIVLSFIGSPYIVKQFAKHEPLVSVQDIEQEYSSQVELVTGHWNELKEEYKRKAVQIHNENSWKGKTSRDARKPKLAMELKASEMQDSLNSAVSYLRKQKDSEISQARKQNQLILQQHESWCFQFGWFGSLVAFGIDVLLILLARMIANHDEKKIKENEKRKVLLDSLQETESRKTEKRTAKKTEKKKEPEFQPVKRNDIQQIFASSKEKQEQKTERFEELAGEKVVFLEMKKGPRKGEFVPKTQEEIQNLINNASNQHSKRTLYLKDLIKQF